MTNGYEILVGIIGKNFDPKKEYDLDLIQRFLYEKRFSYNVLLENIGFENGRSQEIESAIEYMRSTNMLRSGFNKYRLDKSIQTEYNNLMPKFSHFDQQDLENLSDDFSNEISLEEILK